MTDHHHKIFNANDYVPKRFGLNFSPPQIIIEYLSPSSGKLYHHLMRLHKFSKTKSNAEIMKELYERHQMYLDKKKVSSEQLIRLIEKLKENFVPRKKKSNTKDSTTSTAAATAPVPKETLSKKEEKEIPKKENPPKKEEKKDDEIEEDFDLEDLTDEIDKKEEKSKGKPIEKQKEQEVKKEKEKKKEDDELEEEEDEYGGFDDVDEDEDLNKLNDSALDRKKKEMDIVYEKNNIKVGDEDFKYDVRKEFDHEKYAAEWDDDSY